MNSNQMKQCQSIIRKACIAVGFLSGMAYKDNAYALDYEIRKVQIRMLMKIGQIFGREISKRDAKLELKKYGIYVHSMGMLPLGNIANANANIFETKLIGKQFVRKLQIQMGKEG